MHIKSVFPRLFALACVLLLCFAISGCQPTPDAPPVVNRQEDIPQSAIKETPPVDIPETETAQTTWPEAPTYTVLEHWSETIEKADFFTIVADADVYMPDVPGFPVERLERFHMTQEKVNELIAFFIEPGTKFYTGDTVRLKSEYEEDLIRIKANLQQVLNGGDGETPESLRSYIKETEELMAKAPESYTYTYVEPVFTYPTDYKTGEPDMTYGENTISVSLEWSDGMRHGYIGANRYEKGKMNSAGFSYNYHSGGYMQEYYYNWLRAEMDEEEANPPVWANDEWKRDIDRQRKYAEDGLKSMQANTLDKDAAKKRAIALLKELGIDNMQVEDVDRVMVAPERGTAHKDPDYTDPAILVKFKRECGGIPVIEQRGGGFSPLIDYSELYSAPFSPEGISVLIGEDKILCFSWGDAASIVERVAENTELLPLDDIKKRLTDHMFFLENVPEWHTDGSRIRAEISELRLCATYINAKDDPECVLVVPAWHATIRQYRQYPDTGEKWHPSNHDEVFINALDGGAILMPGIVREMSEVQQKAKEHEAEQNGE